MAAKKFWIKRANLPLDKNKRKIVTTTLRWKEEDKTRMVGGVYGQVEKKITIGPDDVVEGDQFEQFVKEGILEPWTEAKAEKDVEALETAPAPVVPITTAPKAEMPKPEIASKAAEPEAKAEEKPKAPEKDEKKKTAKKSKGK